MGANVAAADPGHRAVGSGVAGARVRGGVRAVVAAAAGAGGPPGRGCAGPGVRPHPDQAGYEPDHPDHKPDRTSSRPGGPAPGPRSPGCHGSASGLHPEGGPHALRHRRHLVRDRHGHGLFRVREVPRDGLLGPFRDRAALTAGDPVHRSRVPAGERRPGLTEDRVGDPEVVHDLLRRRDNPLRDDSNGPHSTRLCAGGPTFRKPRNPSSGSPRPLVAWPGLRSRPRGPRDPLLRSRLRRPCLPAPELRTAALPVKGGGNFLAPFGPLRCQELPALIP